MRLSVLASVLGLVLFFGLVGCSSSKRVAHNSPKQAYKKGMKQFEKENYDKALRYFRGVLSYGRGNKWGYRNDPMVPRAEYERARAYYARSPDYQLTQTDTRKAIELFQLFVDRYPDHKLVPKAQKKIDELRAKLAHKKYGAAKLYERRDMWRAATQTYEAVFDQYPDTPWADNALLGALRSYIRYADRSVRQKQAERYQQAIVKHDRLAQLFPESPLLKQAHSLRNEAQRKLERVREREKNRQSFAREDTSEGVN